MINLIYPEKKSVRNQTILNWALDAFDNGETEIKAKTLQEAIDILEDLGFITVAKQGNPYHV